eukprot:832677-Pyramimonas_sp.AAC.1
MAPLAQLRQRPTRACESLAGSEAMRESTSFSTYATPPRVSCPNASAACAWASLARSLGWPHAPRCTPGAAASAALQTAASV